MDHTERPAPICSPETIIQSLPGVVYCSRVDQYWTMEYISNGCLDLTGYTADELLQNRSTSFETLIHADDRHLVRAEVMAALQRGERFAAEYRILHRDGTYRWVSERGAAVAMAEEGGIKLIAGHIQDARAQKAAEAAYREAERRYRSIFENTVEGIYQSTPDGRFITANPAFTRMQGYDTPEELIQDIENIGSHFYIDPNRRAEFLERIARDGVVMEFESQVYRRDRSIIWISENVREVKDASGNVLFFEGSAEDITKRKLQEAVAQFQATHDALTGLLNRTALSKRLETALTERRPDHYVAVLYVDVDQFKYVNDSLGHHVGDQFLRIVASRLCSCLRDTDSVARQGGDEFIILLENLSSREEAAHIAQNILTCVAQPWRINEYEHDIHATCSIGISIAPSDASDVDTMLRHAD